MGKIAAIQMCSSSLVDDNLQTVSYLIKKAKKMGLGVCYDLRFPDLFIKLRKLGAEIIAVPSAFTLTTGKAHWEILTRCRAIDTFCYIVGACQGGLHSNGRQTYGHTMIVDPWGNIIQEIKNPGDAVAYSEIDIENLRKIRASIPTF